MPVYEYQCKRCSNVFEKLVSRDQRDTPGPCPECHCARSQRMMSVFAGHTSGGGSIGGNSCSSCTSGSCSTCHL
ncbi:MAG: zinc ribbon domain-containing protein [Armatimonadetes bacterium]|nr:zinc ribbon domain-containing protein [Armatimonadota bacterium]